MQSAQISSTWAQKLVSIALCLQPHVVTVYRWWRSVALAQGVLSAMEAGALGFRLGLRYRNVTIPTIPDRSMNSMAHWAPFSVWAASAMPPVQLPVFIAMYLAASSSHALQRIIFASAGMYAGAISGFAHGTVQTMLQTLKIVGNATELVAKSAGAVLRTAGVLLTAVLGV